MPPRRTSLRRYQEEDILRWTSNGCRGGWFWDPGLGKTHTAAFLVRRMLQLRQCKRVFIGCPAVAVRTWYEFLTEKANFPPEMIYNCSNPKQDAREPLETEKVIICNYEKLPSKKKQPEYKVKILLDENGIPRGAEKVKNTHRRKVRVFPSDIDFWVLDESHYLKEPSSNAFHFFFVHVRPEHRLLLMSGTPFPNRHISCWSQLTLIKPGVLGRNVTDFRNTYCYLVNKEIHKYELRAKFIPLIDKLAAENCCFRSATLHLDIPPITFENIKYSLNEKQKKCVNTLIADNRVQDKLLKTRATSFLMASQALSGYIDMEVQPQGEPGKARIVEDFGACGKDDALTLFAGSLGEKKAIIWVNFTKTAEKVHKYLTEVLSRKAEYLTAEHKKDLMGTIDRFVNGDVQFIVSHPKIIGISVNYFTGIQYMLWYELTYDWAVYEQAVDRIYRSGQTKATFCYHLVGHRLDEFQLMALKTKKDVHEELARYKADDWSGKTLQEDIHFE